MADLLVLLGFAILLAILAPLYGTDTSDARSEAARPAAGWWPAGPSPRRPDSVEPPTADRATVRHLHDTSRPTGPAAGHDTSRSPGVAA